MPNKYNPDHLTTHTDALSVPVSLTLLTVTDGNASKKLIADKHGQPMPDPDHSLGIGRGRVTHVHVDGLEGLRAFLATVTPRQALVHGIPKGSQPGDSFKLVTAAVKEKRYKDDPRTIARTKTYMAYPPERFILYFDRDDYADDVVHVQSADELLDYLSKVIPALKAVGSLTTASTSSSIRPKDTPDAWLTPPYGMHTYTIATGDVARFRELLKIKLWCAGLGFCKLASPNAHTGVASILERALVDLMVFSPERLDYVAGALIDRKEPFYQERPTPQLRPGGVLDIDALPDATDAERQEYAQRLAAAKDALRPEQRETIRQSIVAQTPELSAEEQDAEITQRLVLAERAELVPDHPLYFGRTDGDFVTARTLSTKAGKAYDGKRLCDPQEPKYRDGQGQAYFHWNKGDWRIVSFAHGITKTYRLVPPEPPEPPDDDVADLLAQTEALGQGKTVMPKGYRLDDKALWYTAEPEEEGGKPVTIRVCAPLHVVAGTRDEDHKNHGQLLQFPDRHGHAHEWAMPLELLEDQREYRKMLRRLGLDMRSATRQFLHEYLEQIRPAERAMCVSRIGWHNGAYVLPEITLGDAGPERLVLQTLNNTTEGYRQAGTLEGWKTDVAALCMGNSRLLFAVSMAFAAPLLALLNEESGGVHLRGTSSEGKTTTTYVAGSVWGEPGRLETWRATSSGLEGVAMSRNDNLLCIDELKQIDAKEAGHVAYMLANGVGRRRSKEGLSLRAVFKWRLLFLSTGELSLETHMADGGQRIQAGQEVRMIDLPADAGKGLGLFEDLHGSAHGEAFAETLKAQTALNYGYAGPLFVERVAADIPKTLTQIRQLMEVRFTHMLPQDAAPQISRVARRCALIGAAGELATAYGLTGWDEGAAVFAAKRCFDDWFAQRGGAGNTDETRSLAQVRLYFEHYGRSRFEPWRLADGKTCQRCHGTTRVSYDYMNGLCFACNGTGVINPDHPAIRNIQIMAGWSKATDDGGTEFFVQPEVFRQDIAKGLDIQGLCRTLKQHGYLRPASGGKNLRSESVPGRPKTTEVYRITADLLGAQQPGEKEEEEGESETS